MPDKHRTIDPIQEVNTLLSKELKMKSLSTCLFAIAVAICVPMVSFAQEVSFFNDTPTIETPTFIGSPVVATPSVTIPEPKFNVGHTWQSNGQRYIVQSRFYDGTEWKYKVAPVITATQLASTSNGFQLKATVYDNRNWTYPGSITNHLQGSIHQVPSNVVASLSPAEQVRLHNQLHGSRQERFSQFYGDQCPGGVCPQTVSVSTPQYYPSTTRPIYRSSCPGGVCPTR